MSSAKKLDLDDIESSLYELKSKIIPIEMIESGEFQAEQVCYLKLDDTSDEIGPLLLDDVKIFIEIDSTRNFKIRRFDNEKWGEAQPQPHFQRIKQSEVEQEEQNAKSLYLLKDGQKSGPFQIEDLKSKLSSGIILYSDSVSVDGEGKWHKLFDFHAFDRRSTELPAAPSSGIYNASQKEVHHELHQVDQSRRETDAIAGLAYIGNISLGKSKDNKVREASKRSEPSLSNLNQSTKESSPDNKKWLFLFLFSAIGLGYMYLNPPQKKSVKKVTKSAEVKKKNKVARDLKAKSPQVKVSKKSIRKPASVKPASRIAKSRARSRGHSNFKNSKAFKKREMLDNAYSESHYDSDNVEHDEIRSRLSKEIIDPENVHGEKYEEDIIDEEVGGEAI